MIRQIYERTLALIGEPAPRAAKSPTSRLSTTSVDAFLLEGSSCSRMAHFYRAYWLSREQY